MKHKARNKGFTLVELLVAMVVFIFVIMAVIGMTLSLIKSQRRIFVLQDIQEAGRFALEFVTKELRTSIDISGAGSSLSATNDDGVAVIYQFDSDVKRLFRNGEPISPSNVNLTGSFFVQEYTTPEPFRVLVTIFMQLEYEDSPLYVQSTVVSRDYAE